MIGSLCKMANEIYKLHYSLLFSKLNDLAVTKMRGKKWNDRWLWIIKGRKL